jgi:hypothetical protein
MSLWLLAEITLSQPVNTGIETQVVASAVTVWLLQWAKNTRKIPWITQDTATLNRLLSALAAAAAAVGIHASYSAGTLTITGLTLSGIVLAALTWLKAFAFNEIIYQAAYNRPASVAAMVFPLSPPVTPATPAPPVGPTPTSTSVLKP